MPLDTRVKHEYDIERALKYEYDNSASSSCHSQIKMSSSCHSRAITRASRAKSCFMPLAFRFAEFGHIPHPVTLGLDPRVQRENESLFFWIFGSSPNMTKGSNNLKMPEGNNNSEETKGNNDICISIPKKNPLW